MGNTYRLRIFKPGAPPIECAGKVEQNVLRLVRANGELLYGAPLERVAGLSHPAPNILRIKLVINNSTVGTMELQEAAVGGNFAPVTALYSELVKSLEGLKGKLRHRAASMEPIATSNFLKQAAASFGAPQDPTAFLTIEGKATAPPTASPAQAPRQIIPQAARPGAATKEPVMLQNDAFEESGPPRMFDDEDDDKTHPSLPQAKKQPDNLLREMQSLRSQLAAAQQRLDTQASSGTSRVADLERSIATLQAELQDTKAAGQRADANLHRQASEQLQNTIRERDAALKAAQMAEQAHEAAQAEVVAANNQIVRLEEALQAAKDSERRRVKGLEEAAAEVSLLNARLNAVTQERDLAQQQAAEVVEVLKASQTDTVTLSQALDEAQAALEERTAAHQDQLASMQETVGQAEDAISSTNTALLGAQETIRSLEERLAAANQRLENASLTTGETQQALEDTQAALRQAQQQQQSNAKEISDLKAQVASSKETHASEQAELASLRSHIEDLQAAVGQAVEEIEAQNEAQAQQQVAIQDLVDQLAAKDAELAALPATERSKDNEDSEIQHLEQQIAQLQAELSEAHAAALPLQAEEARQQGAEGPCSLCELLQSQVQEANLKADTAVADAVTRLAAVENELRFANSELGQVVEARDALLRQNAELQRKQDDVLLRLPGWLSSHKSVLDEQNKEEDTRSLRSALEDSTRKHAQLAGDYEATRALKSALEKAEQEAASAKLQVQQLQAEVQQLQAKKLHLQAEKQHLQAELQKMKSETTPSASSDESSRQRQLQQLRTQLADAETRAASHAVLLQQHQQRKESQERKAAALQAWLQQLQDESAATLAAVQEEAQAKIVDIMQQANDRIAVQQQQAANDKQAFKDAAERADALIKELQDANMRLTQDLSCLNSQTQADLSDTRTCQKDLQSAREGCILLEKQLESLRDQADFDAARCNRLENEVATLTRHLQDTNEDLLQARQTLEGYEESALAAGPGSRLDQQATLPMPARKTGGKGQGVPALESSSSLLSTHQAWDPVAKPLPKMRVRKPSILS